MIKNSDAKGRLRQKTSSQPLQIRGAVVEEVQEYKYLGVVVDKRLDWKSNTETV